MGSSLYAFKIISSKENPLPSDELYELNTDSSLKNTRSELKRLNIDASKEEKVIRFKRFKELFKNSISDEKVYFDAFEGFPNLQKSDIVKIENEYMGKSAKELFYPNCFIYHQLLAETFPVKFHAFKVMEIIVEIVTIHPDVSFPKKRINDKVLLNDNKIFSLRLLTDIYDGKDEKIANSRIYQWYENIKKDSFYDEVPDFNRIIWGFEVLDAVKIKSTSKAFWNKYNDVWWKSYFTTDRLDAATPWEYRKHRIVLPLGWFPVFEKESAVFESTAFC